MLTIHKWLRFAVVRRRFASRSAAGAGEAAALAAQLDVKIYTIGISRNLGRTVNGRSEVDEAMLNAVAEATGGRYFRATSPAELEAVYALLDELEPVEQEASTFRPKRALSWIPLLAALTLASLLALLRSNVVLFFVVFTLSNLYQPTVFSRTVFLLFSVSKLE